MAAAVATWRSLPQRRRRQYTAALPSPPSDRQRLASTVFQISERCACPLVDGQQQHGAAACGIEGTDQGQRRVAQPLPVVTQVQRSAPTLRVLAASLARLGQTDAAAQAIRELLNLEPQLTIVSLRGRLEHMVEGVREPFLDALRLAGSPSGQR